MVPPQRDLCQSLSLKMPLKVTHYTETQGWGHSLRLWWHLGPCCHQTHPSLHDQCSHLELKLLPRAISAFLV